MRRAERGDRLEAVEAADAVVGMHDEVADAEARGLGQDIGGAPGVPARAHEPVAEDVLLADDGEIRRLEALLEAQHGEAPPYRPAAPAPPGSSPPCGVLRRSCSPSSDASRSRAPAVQAATITRLLLALQAPHMADDGIEHVDARRGPLGGEVRPARPPNERTLRARVRRLLERRRCGARRGPASASRPTPRASGTCAFGGTGL